MSEGQGRVEGSEASGATTGGPGAAEEERARNRREVPVMANTTVMMLRESHRATSPRLASPATGPADAAATDPAAPTGPAPERPGPGREPRAVRHLTVADGSKPSREPARPPPAASGSHPPLRRRPVEAQPTTGPAAATRPRAATHRSVAASLNPNRHSTPPTIGMIARILDGRYPYWCFKLREERGPGLATGAGGILFDSRSRFGSGRL